MRRVATGCANRCPHLPEIATSNRSARPARARRRRMAPSAPSSSSSLWFVLGQVGFSFRVTALTLGSGRPRLAGQVPEWPVTVDGKAVEAG